MGRDVGEKVRARAAGVVWFHFEICRVPQASWWCCVSVHMCMYVGCAWATHTILLVGVAPQALNPPEIIAGGDLQHGGVSFMFFSFHVWQGRGFRGCTSCWGWWWCSDVLWQLSWLLAGQGFVGRGGNWGGSNVCIVAVNHRYPFGQC